MPECLDFLSGLLTPTIGGIALYIAYQQGQTNKYREEINTKRLKHELYEKRFAIYNSARNFLRKIMVEKRITDEMLIDYYSGINAARFLLDDELTLFLEKIEGKAVDLQVKQFEAEDNLPVDAKERGEIKKWIYKQIPILNEKFSPYLKLSH